MTIGDLDAVPLIDEEVITGGWTIGLNINVAGSFCHAVSDIYCIAFAEAGADNDLFMATVRVTGAGVITAASLAFHDFGTSGPDEITIQLFKLSEGIVAAFYQHDDGTAKIFLKTFSINAITGAITVVDGPDVVADITNASLRRQWANRAADGVWGVLWPDNAAGGIGFVTITLSDLGIIGSVLDGPDAPADTISVGAWVYLDGGVAINVHDDSGASEAETFSLNETTGIFDITTELNKATGIAPDDPNWVGHIDPSSPAGREVFVLGDDVQGGGGVIGLGTLSINGSDVISFDDSVSVADSDGEERPEGLVIGDRKVFFLGGLLTDSCFVYTADASRNLTQYDVDNALGITAQISSHKPVYLEGSANSKVVVGFVDIATDTPGIVVIGVQVGLDSGQHAIWHAHDF